MSSGSRGKAITSMTVLPPGTSESALGGQFVRQVRERQKHVGNVLFLAAEGLFARQRRRLVNGRCLVDHDHERQRSDLHDVFVLERNLALDLIVVEEGAVGAVEVATIPCLP